MDGDKGKNDSAWRRILARYDVLPRVERDGAFVISAKQIKEFREPRLMAKFDHAISLPKVFKEHSLAILPISRGEYVLSRFDCYMPLAKDAGRIRRMKFPDSVLSIDPNAITSEAVAVNCALASGIFDDFLGEERLVPTVSGRMGSGSFEFGVDRVGGGRAAVTVNNAQIEIDAALESRDSLTLVEAKRDLSDDFIIRQLYYPYRTWAGRIGKRVRLVYLIHSNGVFSLYEYAVEDDGRYNSLKLIRSGRYSVDDTEMRREDIERALDAAQSVPEPEIPFPQADSFERVVNLCELLEAEALTTGAITERYDFDVRQTNYYVNAGRYLGLIEKERDGDDVSYVVTALARDILSRRYRERQLGFCECIFRHDIFRETYREWLRLGRMPQRDWVVAAMRCSNLYKVNKDSTYVRRAGTVTGWLHWVDGLWVKGLFALPPANRV